MDWKALVSERLQSITSDPMVDRDIIEELADDLAQRYEEQRGRGLTHEASLAVVSAELESADSLTRVLRRTRQRGHSMSPVPPATRTRPRLFRDLMQDVRYASRVLLRNRGFTVAVILMLSLGIGASTAIFAVVDAVLLRPLPYPSADRLVALWETDRDSGTMREPSSVPDFLDIRSQSRSFESLGGFVATEFNLTPGSGEPVRLVGAYITSDLLRLLGVRPTAGRAFTPREHELARGEEVLVSERLWHRLSGNSIIKLDDRPRTVVGVLPDDADVGILQWLLAANYARGFADRDARSRIDVWMPLPLDPQRSARGTHYLLVLGQLASGISVPAAQQEMTAVMTSLERAYPDDNRARGAHVELFTSVVLGPARPAIWALLLAVGLVLASACGNVANLLLVRGTGRMREVAVRTALGATPVRLTRQFVVENVLLVTLAAVAGVALAGAGLRALTSLAPVDVPRIGMIDLDLRVLAAAVVLTAAVALVCAVVSGATAWRVDVQRLIAADSGRSATGGPSRVRIRSTLVVAEVALAVALTAGAGLMLRTFWRIHQANAGFRAAGVLKAEFQLPRSRYPVDFRRYPNLVEMHRFNAALLRDVAGLPGVEAAALAGNHPLDAGFTNSFVVVGREAEGRDWPEIAIRRVTPGYFRTLSVPLVRGRSLAQGDDTTATPVILVNEAAARRFFQDRDPLGQRIAYWGAERMIVGVVGNERIHGITQAAPPAIYAPLAQNPSADGGEVLLVRTADPTALAGAVRAAIRRHDQGLAVFGVEPLELTVSESVAQRRFVTVLLVIFAGVALLLAAVGLHAVLSYDVAQRTREIGVRLALGAVPARLVRSIVGHGAMLTGAGLVIGGLAAIALIRLIRRLLFEVSAADPWMMAAVVVLLGGVALVASSLPAYRVVRIDPAVSLRQE